MLPKDEIWMRCPPRPGAESREIAMACFVTSKEAPNIDIWESEPVVLGIPAVFCKGSRRTEELLRLFLRVRLDLPDERDARITGHHIDVAKGVERLSEGLRDLFGDIERKGGGLC